VSFFVQERINTYDTPGKIGRVAKMPTSKRIQNLAIPDSAWEIRFL
jgi:hypothetical protein